MLMPLSHDLSHALPAGSGYEPRVPIQPLFHGEICILRRSQRPRNSNLNGLKTHRERDAFKKGLPNHWDGPQAGYQTMGGDGYTFFFPVAAFSDTFLMPQLPQKVSEAQCPVTIVCILVHVCMIREVE